MTYSCKEFALDDVMAITAIPLANIPANDIHSPANKLTATISKNDFNPALTNAITIGLQPATPGGILVPIRKLSGKAEDKESDSVAGRLHTVTVTCEIDDRDNSVWENLLTLERTYRHLIVTFRDMTKAFISATQDSYLFTTDRDGGTTSATFRIYNHMGIQPII